MSRGKDRSRDWGGVSFEVGSVVWIPDEDDGYTPATVKEALPLKFVVETGAELPKVEKAAAVAEKDVVVEVDPAAKAEAQATVEKYKDMPKDQLNREQKMELLRAKKLLMDPKEVAAKAAARRAKRAAAAAESAAPPKPVVTKNVKRNQIWPLNPPIQDGVQDNTQLTYLNEPHLIHNIRQRYKKDEIYTYTGYILIAVNPYKQLPIYDNKISVSYRGKPIGVMPPHVYAVADRAYRDLKVNGANQSIIVSGESGAGKTETCKFAMRHLTAVGGDSRLGGVLEDKIMKINPLLEAFGNARTARNSNSSRFGKFTEIHFDEKSHVIGARISTYVLEKSRVVLHQKGERNYHFFYQVCAGATEEEKQMFNLGAADNFVYLNQGEMIRVPGLNDRKQFGIVREAMAAVGLSKEEDTSLMRVAAGLLHLGNVEIYQKRFGTRAVVVKQEEAMDMAAQHLGCKPKDLWDRLTHRFVKVACEKRMYKVPFLLNDAIYARDALAKQIYGRMFDWLVARINLSIPFSASKAFIGVLDIAGFEFFENNSFEQFCINFANEKLQQHFNAVVLYNEQDVYNKEGLNVPPIEVRDNQQTIDLIEKKDTGILGILNEEGRLPGSNDPRFARRVHGTHSENASLMSMRRATKQTNKGRFNDNEAFIIRHFAGDVCYNVEGFLDKNSDPLHESLEQLLLESSIQFNADLFSDVARSEFSYQDSVNVEDEEELKKMLKEKGEDASEATGPLHNQKAKKKKLTVGWKFRSQLRELMQKLAATHSNFIRCINPNHLMTPNMLMGGSCLHQLRCSGMIEALQLMHAGYPTRCPFELIVSRYKDKVPSNIAALPPPAFCEALLSSFGLFGNYDFQVGASMVFFRTGRMAFLDKLTEASFGSAEVMDMVNKWIVSSRLRRLVAGVRICKRIENGVRQRRAFEKKLVPVALAIFTLAGALENKVLPLRRPPTPIVFKPNQHPRDVARFVRSLATTVTLANEKALRNLFVANAVVDVIDDMADPPSRTTRTGKDSGLCSQLLSAGEGAELVTYVAEGSVNVNGNMALVWAHYAIKVKGAPVVCGMHSLDLFLDETLTGEEGGEWRILRLTDTRHALCDLAAQNPPDEEEEEQEAPIIN